MAIAEDHQPVEQSLVAWLMGRVLFDDVSTAVADSGCQADMGASSAMPASRRTRKARQVRHRRRACYLSAVARYLVLHGFMREEPVAGTWKVKEAIGAAGGFILQARMFSNKALALSFEVSAARVPDLPGALSAAGLALYDESALALAQFCDECGDQVTSEVSGLLNVAFIHGDPDEKTEVPSVPG